ncbi:MAG: pyridoxal phosphate-dependent aminotransferase [Oscillospiraceae bacterium]|nr:pyridoxal phosphate-dependent aminotransferase [Oscillospiraceae bacterium]
MKLSKRILNINPSATLELSNRVSELRAQGVDIISYNVGEPDFFTPENIREAGKRAIDEGKTTYTPVAGIPELRRMISEKLQNDNNITYSPQEICLGVGAKQPLLNAVLAVCDDGTEVIIPTPCWVSYIEMVKLAGATPVLVPCKEEDGFELDMAAIEAAVTERTSAVLINTPNNPTGAVYSEETLRKLASLAVERDFVVIADEIYEKLIYNGKKHFSIASISPEVREHVVTINGFSKAYAMTGWRIGYSAAPLPITKGISAIMSHATSNICTISQYAGVEALTGPQESIENMRKEFDRRRVFLYERLNSIEGITCTQANGAFYLLPNVTFFFGKKTPDGRVLNDSFDVANFLLDDAHIAVVPGAAFEAPDNLRISYSNSLEALTIGMDRMEASLKKLV